MKLRIKDQEEDKASALAKEMEEQAAKDKGTFN